MERNPKKEVPKVRKTTKKTVKAYVAVCKPQQYRKVTGKIECADYFVLNDCCCCDETRALAVFETKKDAETSVFNLDNHAIIPCTITYELPVKKK